jgi:hypothetical protein
MRDAEAASDGGVADAADVAHEARAVPDEARDVEPHDAEPHDAEPPTGPKPADGEGGAPSDAATPARDDVADDDVPNDAASDAPSSVPAAAGTWITPGATDPSPEAIDSQGATAWPAPTPQTWGAPDNAFAPTFTPYAPAAGPPATTSAKAIASLVLSLLWFCGLGSLVAVILGHLARGDIKRSQGRVGGQGLATAGLVIGYLGLVFTVAIGGIVAVAAIDEGVGTARQSEGRDGSLDDAPAPQVPAPGSTDQPRQVQPVSGVCPDVDALTKVVPPGTDLVLFNSTRGVEDGVVECLYTVNGLPPAQAPYVLVALQDDLTTQSVEEYFTQRELAPPTDAQLGAAKGKADRFGYDTYDSPGSNIPYVDTGAARGNRSAVLSVPASFNISDPVLFATTVELLDGIRVPDNVI